MTAREYHNQILKIEEAEELWVKEKELIQRKQRLKQEKASVKSTKRKMSTTKLIVAFIMLNCTIVEIYSMWVMYKLMDLSALYTLITAVIGEAMTFAIYAIKATKENTSGGIIYEQAKQLESSRETNSGSGAG